MTNENNISIAIFTCEDYSDLWEANIFFLKQNFPLQKIYNIYLVTDKPTAKIIDNIRIIWPDNSCDHISKLRCFLNICTSPFFLFTLDDYFFTKPISYSFINNSIDFVLQKNANYLRLGIRHNNKIEHPQYFDNLKIYYLKTHIPYAIDLYPAIWKREFALETIEKWPFSENTIWHYEGKMHKMNNFMSLDNCFSAKGKGFYFEDVIRKGGLLNHAHRVLSSKYDIDLTKTRRLRTKREDFVNKIGCIATAWVPAFIKNIVKKKMRNKGKTFFSD